MLKLVEKLRAAGGELIVVGDVKGPQEYLPEVQFFSLSDQLALPFGLVADLPTSHYGRKNLGYLIAIRQQADCIYETDDDNAPSEGWAVRSRITWARKATTRHWANVYRMFSNENIWPRGFPLELINDPATYRDNGESDVEELDAPIQQGLANASPDVDAIWRLVLDRDFTFQTGPSIWLPPGTWCPFNSQTTWWWPPVYTLLYLPSYCSFRMTDIFRSFVAQRCLWELGHGVVFHAPEVIQERNPHNLLRDFADEISGYLQNSKIAQALTDLSLHPGPDQVPRNMRICYEELVRIAVLPPRELPLVDAWLTDLETIRGLESALVNP